MFFKYIGTNQEDLHELKFKIDSLIQWWLLNNYSLRYDDTKNGAHGNFHDHTIYIGNEVMSKPVIQNDRAEISIVAALFHESTHAVLGFSDYSTNIQGMIYRLLMLLMILNMGII